MKDYIPQFSCGACSGNVFKCVTGVLMMSGTPGSRSNRLIQPRHPQLELLCRQVSVEGDLL